MSDPYYHDDDNDDRMPRLLLWLVVAMSFIVLAGMALLMMR